MSSSLTVEPNWAALGAGTSFQWNGDSFIRVCNGLAKRRQCASLIGFSEGPSLQLKPRGRDCVGIEQCNPPLKAWWGGRREGGREGEGKYEGAKSTLVKPNFSPGLHQVQNATFLTYERCVCIFSQCGGDVCGGRLVGLLS